MRCGFVTCVQLGLSCIQVILDMNESFDLFVTLSDDVAVNKSGRVYLDEVAKQNGIPLVKVRNINDRAAAEAIREADLDWLFIIGWSQIARTQVLDAPRHGALGMHPTLLPEGRGRASIPWAILKGLSETGVTLFQLDEGVDTGPILAQERIAIEADETATSLYAKVMAAHVSLMTDTWPHLANGTIKARVQDDSVATTWPGRRPEDGEFTFADSTTSEVDRLVRALTRPYPGAFTRKRDQIVRIWEGHPVDSGTANDPHTFRTKDGYYRVTEADVEVASDLRPAEESQ